jgi:hypothetical protein
VNSSFAANQLPNRASEVAQISNLLYRGVALRWGSASSKGLGVGGGLAEYDSAIRQFTKLRYECDRTQPF